MEFLKNKRKIDIEAKLFVTLLGLKEELDKQFSIEECDKNVVYLFEDYEEFKNYFELNGFIKIDEGILEICKMKTTRKGTIIALKGLCDYAIRRHSLMNIYGLRALSEERNLGGLLDLKEKNYSTYVKKNRCKKK